MIIWPSEMCVLFHKQPLGYNPVLHSIQGYFLRLPQAPQQHKSVVVCQKVISSIAFDLRLHLRFCVGFRSCNSDMWNV